MRYLIKFWLIIGISLIGSLRANSQTSVPDSLFREYLSAKFNLTFNNNNQIINSEVSDTVTSIDVAALGIADLTGIGGFPQLISLNCSFNQLTHLDLSSNNSLEILNCNNNNKLASIIFPAEPALKMMECSSLNIVNLDISGLHELKSLVSNFGKLETIKFPLNSKIEKLDINFNKLDDLNVSNQAWLVELDCRNNLIDSLNLSGSVNLERLDAGENKLVSVNLSANKGLKYLNVSSNLLNAIDVSACISLIEFYCYNNILSELEVTSNAVLQTLICFNNNLTKIFLSDNQSLSALNCDQNKIISLNLSPNKNIKSLSCRQNMMTELTLPVNSALNYIDCSENNLTQLDLSQSVGLKSIIIQLNPNLKKVFVWTIFFPPQGVTVIQDGSPVTFLLGSSIDKPDIVRFIDRVGSLADGFKSAVVDSFMNANKTLPLIEKDTIVTYIHRGSATSVSVAGDENNWTINAMPLTKLTGTDFWYLIKTYESDARLDYKFVLNGNTWIFDPKNPNTAPGGLGANSELRMPKYIPAKEIEFDPAIPHGEIISKTINSTNLGNSRQIKIYLPPFYASSTADSFPLVIFHDGLEFISLAKANNTIDYLIHNKLINPIIAVFIPPVNRSAEYIGNKTMAYSKFVTEEIMAMAANQYRVKNGQENKATIGISNGGDISQFLGLKFSNIIGNVGAMSPGGNFHTNAYMSSPVLPIRFYIDAGTYDLPSFLNNSVFFVSTVLLGKGYDHVFNIYHEGHSWANWRAHLDNILIRFFPYSETSTSVSDNREKNITFVLHQNYPNPFNPSTRLNYSLPKNGRVTIKVYNSLGQEIAKLVDEFQKAGVGTVGFNADKYSAGVYFAVMWVDHVQFNTVKMILMK